MDIVISIINHDLEGITDIIPQLELLSSEVHESVDSIEFMSEFPDKMFALLSTYQVIFSVIT